MTTCVPDASENSNVPVAPVVTQEMLMILSPALPVTHTDVPGKGSSLPYLPGMATTAVPVTLTFVPASPPSVGIPPPPLPDAPAIPPEPPLPPVPGPLSALPPVPASEDPIVSSLEHAVLAAEPSKKAQATMIGRDIVFSSSKLSQRRGVD